MRQIRARLWQSRYGSSSSSSAVAAAAECQIPQSDPDGLDSWPSESNTILQVLTVSIGGLQIPGQPLRRPELDISCARQPMLSLHWYAGLQTYGLAVSKTPPCKSKLICRASCTRRPAAPVMPPGSYLRSLTSCLVANMQHVEYRLALFLKVVQPPPAHQSLPQMSSLPSTFGTNRRSSVHVKMALVRGKIQIGKSSSRRQ